MRQAIRLARQGLGRTAPNPPVGALIVKEGRVIGKGFHPQAGMPHAEVYALEHCRQDARGATLYVTLEPCAHFGKTPPCTDAILRAGIARVVIGTLDPNPLVAGKGALLLRQAGVEIEEGVCRSACRELIHSYAHWVEKGEAYPILKAAITLDGRIAADSGDSRWISSEASRRRVHRLRNHMDAVLVGIGTVLQDDPQLTCRVPGGRDPHRVILDRDLQIPSQSRCLGEKCILLTAGDPGRRPDLASSGCRILSLPTGADGRFSWQEILGTLGQLGFHSVLVEGGSGVYSSFLGSDRLQKMVLFLAPRILGGGIPLVNLGRRERVDQARPLRISHVSRSGCDIVMEAYPEV